MACQLQLGTGQHGFELGFGLLCLGVEFDGFGVDIGLQRIQLQCLQLQQRCLPLAFGGQRLNAQGLACGLASGMQIRRERNGHGWFFVGLCRIDGHRGRQRMGFKTAVQRSRFQAAVQVCRVELLDLQLTLKDLRRGNEVAAQIDLAFANIDQGLIYQPLAVVETNLGLQVFHRQALLVPRAGQGVAELRAQCPGWLAGCAGLGGLADSACRVGLLHRAGAGLQFARQGCARPLWPEGCNVQIFEHGLGRQQGLRLPGGNSGLNIGQHGGRIGGWLL